MNVFPIINHVEIFCANYNQPRMSNLWFWCTCTNTAVVAHGHVKDCSRFDFTFLYKLLGNSSVCTSYGATQLSLKQD